MQNVKLMEIQTTDTEGKFDYVTKFLGQLKALRNLEIMMS